MDAADGAWGAQHWGSWTIDWRHYTRALDRDTLAIEERSLERIDLQLLSMVDHARVRLADDSRSIDEQILLNGFSASGNFVDRFTVLHPDRVRSVTAGGLNGMALLSLDRAKGHTLNFHVGIGDVEELTGEPVDLDALDATNQFLYMGGIDFNDTLPYNDAWTSEELKQTALDVYGRDMIDDRFPFCQTAYEQAGVAAQFRVYNGVAHNPRPAKDDIVEFHRRSIEGEDVSDMGQQLNGPAGLPTASFVRTPETPVADESVSFDATASTPGGDEILSYSWNFDDGTTAAGAQVEHTFASAGEYTVRLKVVDDLGIVDTVTTDIEVSARDQSTGHDTSSAETDTSSGGSETSTPTDLSAERGGSATTFAEGPAESSSGTSSGFGIGITVMGVVGGAYLLETARGEDDEK